jgi:hypothetical protein
VGLVTRRYLPPDEQLAAVLAVRIDVLEGQTKKIRGDVAALTRGVSDLTGQIRRLTTLTTPASSAGHGGSHGGQDDGNDRPDDAGDDDEAGKTGQPDWFTVPDVETARTWLGGLTAWVGAVLTHHGVTLPVACWPLHPAVVVDLLALSQERAGAYGGDTPTPVSEWLSRWLPAAGDRITTALTGCAADRGHRHDGRVYDTTGFDPLSAAAWWVLDRDTPAPDAFALTPLT